MSMLSEELVHALVRERQSQAAAAGRVARLRAARRWQRRAEVASYRANRARLAVR